MFIKWFKYTGLLFTMSVKSEKNTFVFACVPDSLQMFQKYFFVYVL